MKPMERERFEAWITGPPYERDTSRHPGSDEQTAWPGQYVDLAVQLAWEAWQEAAPRWTAVAAELPAEGVPVLVKPRKSKQLCVVWWAGRGRFWTGPNGLMRAEAWASHWRPLPAGPREEGEEDGR